MIVVDTSVWVSALRDRSGSEAIHLQELLDDDRVAMAAPVRVEILSGASARDLAPLRRVLSALPIFVPQESTWTLMNQWIESNVRAGERFGFADLLIGALAAERRAEVWSLDADFERMERRQLITRHSEP